MKFLKFLFAISLPVILLSSCQVNNKVTSSGPFQKRKYQKGYHISLGKDQGKISEPTQELEPLEANSGEMVPTDIGIPKKLSLQDLPDLQTDCDIITKQNGEEIKAKVKKIGPEMVEYKKCGRESGPTYTIKKSNIFMIKYPDGEKDVFGSGQGKEDKPERFPEEEEKQKQGEYQKEEQEDEEEGGNNAFDVLGFIFSLIGVIFFAATFGVSLYTGLGLMLVSLLISILAIIFSAIGDGGLGDAGLIIGIINAALAAIVLVLVLSVI